MAAARLEREGSDLLAMAAYDVDYEASNAIFRRLRTYHKQGIAADAHVAVGALVQCDMAETLDVLSDVADWATSFRALDARTKRGLLARLSRNRWRRISRLVPYVGAIALHLRARHNHHRYKPSGDGARLARMEFDAMVATAGW